MQKRGISAVIATVLIILITVAAITIIWAALIPMIKNNIASGDLSTDLSIDSSSGYSFWDSSSNISCIQVKRGADNSELTEIQVIFSWGGESETRTLNSSYIPGKNQGKIACFYLGGKGKPDSISIAAIMPFSSGSKVTAPLSTITDDLDSGVYSPNLGAIIDFNEGFRQLSRADYYDKAYGNWMGQTAGNFLGMPTEASFINNPNPAMSIYYSPFNSFVSGTCSPTNFANCIVKSQTDDDTSIEWLDIHILEQYGLRANYLNIRDEWVAHINSTAFWVANRQARDLMNATKNPPGYLPPDTGKMPMNTVSWSIDSQIEIELFGVISPGMVDVAKNKADFFARVTNDGNAVDYSKFYAMMYSEAFFENNITKIIEKVKSNFSQSSKVVSIVNNVEGWWGTNPNWRDTRNQINATWGTEPWYGGTLNFASVIMSVLYSQDANVSTQFDTGVQIATLSGWDNDCNAATTGGFLGVLAGASHIPAKWKSPMVDLYINTNMDPATLGNDTLTNMATRTVNLGEQNILANGGQKIGAGANIVYKIPNL